MTAPVRTLAAKFTAEGSATVQAAIDRVVQRAQEAAARVAQGQQAAYRMTVVAAERAAHAEQAARERTASAAQATVALTSRAMSDKYGMVALSAASSFNMMAASGTASAEAIKNVVQQTALVAATAFGVGGPVVAAFAVSAVALTNFFARAQEEAKKARAEIEKNLRVIAVRGDYNAAGGMLRDLLQGDPAAQAGSPEQVGLARLRQQVRDARAGQTRRALAGGGFEVIATREETTRITALEAALAKLEARYTSVQATFDTVARREQERLATIASLNAKAEPGATAAPISALSPLASPGRSSSVAGGAPSLSRLTRDKAGSPLALEGVDLLAKESVDRISAAFQAHQSALSTGIADTLAGGIAAGIGAAIASGSVSGALSALGQSMLGSLGNVFAEIAARAIMQAQLMVTFQKFLNTHPVLALAAAGAMMVAARAMGGRAGSRGGMGGGGGGGVSYAGAAAAAASASVTRLVFGTDSIALAAGMTRVSPTNVTIIGPNDPVAQRQILELIRAGERRG